jgi:hypothetical protein
MQYLTALDTGAVEIGYLQVVPMGLVKDPDTRVVYYAVRQACLYKKIERINPVGIRYG